MSRVSEVVDQCARFVMSRFASGEWRDFPVSKEQVRILDNNGVFAERTGTLTWCSDGETFWFYPEHDSDTDSDTMIAALERKGFPKVFHMKQLKERAMGIEPTSPAWKAGG